VEMKTETWAELPIFRSEKQKPAGTSFWKRVWEGWKKVGLFIGKVNLYVLTFVIFWTVFGVTALIAKLLRRDFLMIRSKKGQSGYWVELPSEELSEEEYYHQF